MVSGTCWPTEMVMVLCVLARVMGWVSARLVRWTLGFFQGNLGVSLGDIGEEVMDSESLFEILEAGMLVKLHEVGN